MTVFIVGDTAAGSELHIEIEVATGPTPDTLRVWIGNESGAGAMKAKADRSGSHFHVHVEVPVTIDKEDAIWIEVQTAEGSRQRGSVALP